MGMADQANKKGPERPVSFNQTPPCGGCPSRIYVALNRLDASGFELASVAAKLLDIATSLSVPVTNRLGTF